MKPRKMMKKALLVTVSSTILAGYIGTALAEDAAVVGLEEIVVTARKREESLQTAPVSINAFTGEALDRAGVGTFLEVASRVPGFAMNEDNVTEPNVFMRGIGTDIESAGSNPAIGFFMDDVYLSRAMGTNLAFFDFERVEVVKGPQGTLYGKNVVGGAINYITKKPTEETDVALEGTVGNYTTIETRGHVSGALTDKVFAKVSVATKSHDGYAYNTYTKNDIEDLNSTGILGQLRFLPSDDLEVLVTADFTRRRGNGRWVDMQVPSDHNVPFKNEDPRRGPNNIDGQQDADVGGAYLRFNYDTGVGTLTSISAFRQGDFRFINNDAGSYIDFRQFTYDANGRANIGALTPEQVDATNDDYYVNDKSEKVKTISQEFRFASNFDGPFNFLTGVFYMHEKIDRSEIANYLFILYDNNGGETAITDAKNDTYAAFVEGTYKVTDAVGITAGIRYTKDKKHFSVFRDHVNDFLGASFEDDAGNPVDSFSTSTKKSWSSWTPSLTVNWNVTDEAFVYATVSKGFKSGGWNGENANLPSEATQSYNPEYAWNYELGAKTQWFDNRLRFNVTGFWTEYKDLQTQQYVLFDPNLPADNIISNAGKARVRGVELELVAVPVEGLTIAGNYAYMNGEITGDLISTDLQFSFDCFCSIPVDTNLKGNKLRRTPKHAFTVSGFYEFPISDSVNGFVRGDYSWNSGYQFDNENNPRTEIKSFGILNAGLGIATADGKWEFSIWGKNLTDKLYETGKTDDIGTVLVSYAPPRTYGATVKWKY